MRTSRSITMSRCRLGAIVVLFAASILIVQASEDPALDYVPGEIVVKLFNPADLAAVATMYDLDPVPLAQFGTRPIYRLQITDGMPPPDKAVRLLADPQRRIQYAEPNFEAETPEGRQRISWSRGGDTGEYIEQWAGERIRLSEAHKITRGEGVIVAVLDTGVDPAHPQLAGKLVDGRDFVNEDGDPSEEGTPQDIAYGHGTHVAGLVALAAPEAKIMPLRVLQPDGVGNVWVLAEALAYAAISGADVINLSLSTTRPTKLLQEVVSAVTCSESSDDDDDDSSDMSDPFDNDSCLTPGGTGAVVVAAAGNSGTTQREYPAAEAVAGVLAVAASTQQDTLATFSTRGNWVDVAAPGEQIISSVPGGDFGVWSGTSMAAPLTAGTAALIRSQNPELYAIQVGEQIIDSAASIAGEVPRRLDAAAAVGASHRASELARLGICEGIVGAIAVDNLRVLSNQTCALYGTHIKGSIKLESNAALMADGVRVGGSIQADKSAMIDVRNATIHGSIQIKEGGVATVLDTYIGGDMQLTSNYDRLTIHRNVTGGNIQIEKNRGGALVYDNRISGNLQCKENLPHPVGSGNIVNGNRQGQCTGF
jgi:thermitase